MTAIYVVASFTVKPESITQGSALIQGLAGPSLTQNGCLFYDVYQSIENNSEFVIVDGWATQEDIDGHANSEHVAKTVERLNPLLAGPISVKTYRKLS